MLDYLSLSTTQFEIIASDPIEGDALLDDKNRLAIVLGLHFLDHKVFLGNTGALVEHFLAYCVTLNRLGVAGQQQCDMGVLIIALDSCSVGGVAHHDAARHVDADVDLHWHLDFRLELMVLLLLFWLQGLQIAPDEQSGHVVVVLGEGEVLVECVVILLHE